MMIQKKKPNRKDLSRTTQELEIMREEQEKELKEKARRIQELVPHPTPLPLEAPAK